MSGTRMEAVLLTQATAALEAAHDQIVRLTAEVDRYKQGMTTTEVEIIGPLRERLAEAERERDGWRARFRALVQEDRPDMAGNAVIRLRSQRDRAVECLRELAVRVQNYGPSPVMPEGEALYEALSAAAKVLRGGAP